MLARADYPQAVDGDSSMVQPRPTTPVLLEKFGAQVLALAAAQPDLTLLEMVAELRKRQIRTSSSSLWRFLRRYDITLKKKFGRRGARVSPHMRWRKPPSFTEWSEGEFIAEDDEWMRLRFRPDGSMALRRSLKSRRFGSIRTRVFLSHYMMTNGVLRRMCLNTAEDAVAARRMATLVEADIDAGLLQPTAKAALIYRRAGEPSAVTGHAVGSAKTGRYRRAGEPSAAVVADVRPPPATPAAVAEEAGRAAAIQLAIESFIGRGWLDREAYESFCAKGKGSPRPGPNAKWSGPEGVLLVLQVYDEQSRTPKFGAAVSRVWESHREFWKFVGDDETLRRRFYEARAK
jgi:hypothetical protein